MAQRVTGPQQVTEIRIEGGQRIEAETVRSYGKIRVGDAISPQAMDKALKRLFATGLFSDVIVRRDGSAIVIRVVENPIINRIAFEGNKRITDQVLQDEVKLRPRIVYTRSRVQNDVQRLINVYRRNGRFAASVDPKVVRLAQNRVDLIFEIKEGPITKIRRIDFIGNKRFGDGKLREIIRTQESIWYRFLTSDDNYDPDRLTFDRELLRRFYLGRGYADFRVISAVAELSPNRGGFFITFTVEEGKRYKFGNVSIETSVSDLKPEQLRQFVGIEKGSWYNADSVEKAIIKLTDISGALGYAFVDIRPEVRRRRDERKIDMIFRVKEGPKVYVERINIVGNVRTIDPVIRREMALVEGDAFNTAKIRRSQRRIQALGFFEKVNLTNKPGSTPDKTIIQIAVAEQSTGSLALGAGFSSSDGVLANVGIRERNLLGRGQDLLLNTQLSGSSSQIDLQFTEPYFLDKKLSVGFDLFRTTRDFSEESSFKRETVGAGVRIGFGYSEKLRQRLHYRISQDEINEIDSDASLAIKEQEGSALKSEIGQIISYDARDNGLDPTEGYFIRLSTDLAGLGGSVKYLRNRLSGSYYIPITERVTGRLSLTAGYIFGFDSDVRIVDRFNLGGANLRGFANSGAGPRDTDSDDAVGGNWIYNGTAQVSFPIGLPNEFGIRGRAFTDFGSLSDSDSSLGNIQDTKSIRASIGVGLSWKSPFGPVSIDFSQALLKEDFDITEAVRFEFGARF
jgi:outer membrane protein insertion porin family